MVVQGLFRWSLSAKAAGNVYPPKTVPAFCSVGLSTQPWSHVIKPLITNARNVTETNGNAPTRSSERIRKVDQNQSACQGLKYWISGILSSCIVGSRLSPLLAGKVNWVRQFGCCVGSLGIGGHCTPRSCLSKTPSSGKYGRICTSPSDSLLVAIDTPPTEE